jgi:hypothetical protein
MVDLMNPMNSGIPKPSNVYPLPPAARAGARPYPLSSATPAPLIDEIEVPVPPDVEFNPVAEEPDPEPEQPETAPVSLPIWEPEDVARLQADMDATQHAKDQVVALAAAMTAAQEKIAELTARIEALEAR